MQENTLIIASSPHLHSGESVERIMYTVAAALLLPAAGSIYFFGMRALGVIIVAVLSALATEAVFLKLRNKPIQIHDGSALVTGLLLALNLPANLPLWMVAVGSIVAISLGKQIFGGIGQNPFNPALIGRVFLMLSFTAPMTSWINPVDGVAGATPLALMKMESISTSYSSLFFGNVGGSMGETSAFLIIIGGLYLWHKDFIDIIIPTMYLGSVAVLTLALGQDPIFHLLAGGLMLGAFFMATDMVTSPLTKKGKIIFGLGAGLFTVIIRLYGGYPEGVSFSILLMNSFTPIINRYTRPKIYGEVRAR